MIEIFFKNPPIINIPVCFSSPSLTILSPATNCSFLKFKIFSLLGQRLISVVVALIVTGKCKNLFECIGQTGHWLVAGTRLYTAFAE